VASPDTGDEEMFNELIESLGLKQKDNMTLSIIISVTGDTVNSVTMNAEGSFDEPELVFKTFDTVDGVMDSAKGMARLAGFPTSAEEYAASGGKPENPQKDNHVR
jgi:hypothetical protein